MLNNGHSVHRSATGSDNLSVPRNPPQTTLGEEAFTGQEVRFALKPPEGSLSHRLLQKFARWKCSWKQGISKPWVVLALYYPFLVVYKKNQVIFAKCKSDSDLDPDQMPFADSTSSFTRQFPLKISVSQHEKDTGSKRRDQAQVLRFLLQV